MLRRIYSYFFFLYIGRYIFIFWIVLLFRGRMVIVFWLVFFDVIVVILDGLWWLIIIFCWMSLISFKYFLKWLILLIVFVKLDVIIFLKLEFKKWIYCGSLKLFIILWIVYFLLLVFILNCVSWFRGRRIFLLFIL